MELQYFIIIINYFQNIYFFNAVLGLDVSPDMFRDMWRGLMAYIISLNTTRSGCKPRSSMSSFTHTLKVFLPLPLLFSPPPLHFYRLTPNQLHSYIPDTPNSLNLIRLTPSATLWTQKRLSSSTSHPSSSCLVHTSFYIKNVTQITEFGYTFEHWVQSQPRSATLIQQFSTKLLLQWKSTLPVLFNLPEMPLHPLWTQIKLFSILSMFMAIHEL